MKNLILLSFVIAGSLATTSPSQAFGRADGTFDRTGSYQNSRGGMGTFNRSYTHSPGSTSGTRSWTNARGTGTYTFNNNWNKSVGTGTHQSSTVYANGKTSSSDGTVTRTAPGDFSYAGTHTGVNGNVTDVDRTSSFNSTTDTRTVDNTFTNPTTGKSATVDKTVGYGADGKTVDKTATGPNGKSVTSDQTYTKTNDGYTKDGTVTGPNGKTATDGSTVTYTHNANGTITRTQTSEVTGPNGNEHTGSNTENYTQYFTPAATP